MERKELVWAAGIVMLTMTAGVMSARAEVRSAGSGFVINQYGDLITNNHVISYSLKHKKTGQRRSFLCSRLEISGGDYEGDAKIVGRDQKNDLAVLRLTNNTKRPDPAAGGNQNASSSNGKWRSLGDELAPKGSDGIARTSPSKYGSAAGGQSFATISTGDLRPGEPVIAVGFPLSFKLSSEPKVVTGVLAGTAGYGNDVTNLQHSAPINHGNSGGPLFDASGRVMGVNVAGLAPDKTGAQNVNFAVKADMTRALLDSLKVPYRSSKRGREMRTEEIMARATRYTVKILCHF